MQNTSKDIFIFNISILTIIVLTLEGTIMRHNKELFIDSMKDPFLISKQFTLLYMLVYCLLNAVRAVLYTNAGYAFVFFAVAGFITHKKIEQGRTFETGAIYITQLVIFAALVGYFAYTAVRLYHDSIWKYFKFIGANKKIINAYIIRQSLQGLREAFVLYVIVVTLYLTIPDLYPGIRKMYKPWKIIYTILVVVTAYREDEERRLVKVVAVISYFVVFLDILLDRVVRSIVLGNDGFAFDTYVAIILFLSVLLSLADFYMYGSGLKEFLTKKNKRKIQVIE